MLKLMKLIRPIQVSTIKCRKNASWRESSGFTDRLMSSIICSYNPENYVTYMQKELAYCMKPDKTTKDTYEKLKNMGYSRLEILKSACKNNKLELAKIVYPDVRQKHFDDLSDILYNCETFEMFEYFKTKGFPIKRFYGKENETLLMNVKDIEIAKLILDKFPDKEYINHTVDGKSALYNACYHGRSRKEIVDLLLSRGAIHDFELNGVKDLMRVSEFTVDVMRSLVKYGYNMNKLSVLNESVLTFVCDRAYRDRIEYLLSVMSPNVICAIDHNGLTPISYCIVHFDLSTSPGYEYDLDSEMREVMHKVDLQYLFVKNNIPINVNLRNPLINSYTGHPSLFEWLVRCCKIKTFNFGKDDKQKLYALIKYYKNNCNVDATGMEAYNHLSESVRMDIEAC